MKADVPSNLALPLPRRDIVAICTYLNRSRPQRVDRPRTVCLDKVADAARMQ